MLGSPALLELLWSLPPGPVSNWWCSRRATSSSGRAPPRRAGSGSMTLRGLAPASDSRSWRCRYALRTIGARPRGIFL